MRLAVTLTAGQASDLAGEVLDRVNRATSPVGTVILALEGSAGVDERCRQALCSLHDRLRGTGVRLRLVAATPQARQQLRDAGKDHSMSPLAVHPSLRSAVLATYAELPGPGLVTGPVRAALALPAEPLHLRRSARRASPAALPPPQMGARRELAGRLGSPESARRQGAG